MSKFYVYIYLDPSKPGSHTYGPLAFEMEPFYVGKGTGKRYSFHTRESLIRKDTNSHKVNRIRAIQAQGLDPLVQILQTFEEAEEQRAYDFETELICLIGRRDLKTGPLVNLIDRQNQLSPEAKTAKAAKTTGELNGMFGKKHSEAAKAGMSRGHKLLVGVLSPGFGRPSPLRGKSYEEILGPIKAETIRNLRRQAAIANGLGGGRPVGSISLQERQLASERMHKRNLEQNPSAKPVTLRGKCYPSIEEASRDLGITRYYVMKELKGSKNEPVDD